MEMMRNQRGKFTGVGTVLQSRIVNIDQVLMDISPEESIRVLKAHLDHVLVIIEKNKGTVVSFQGDEVLAFWHPENTKPGHAQLAFDASCIILESLLKSSIRPNDIACQVGIALGTGEFGGDFFGPMKQFQIIGNAVSIAHRLFEVKPPPGSFIRMSQHTADTINVPGKLKEEGAIEKDGADTLKVYIYSLAG